VVHDRRSEFSLQNSGIALSLPNSLIMPWTCRLTEHQKEEDEVNCLHGSFQRRQAGHVGVVLNIILLNCPAGRSGEELDIHYEWIALGMIAKKRFGYNKTMNKMNVSGIKFSYC